MTSDIQGQAITITANEKSEGATDRKNSYF
jgi:hypothetical protein